MLVQPLCCSRRPAASVSQTKKTHENGVGHKRAVEEFLKTTFSKGREERTRTFEKPRFALPFILQSSNTRPSCGAGTEDKELQEELRAIEEAALKSFETDLRKKGVGNYRDAARQTMHDNRLSRQGVRPPPRRDWGGSGGPTGEAAAAAVEPEEVPEWKRAQLEAARLLELASLWYYIDAAGTQQGPHPLSSMQSWYNAGYFPPGTMVARDGEGDEAAWVDISVCYKVNQQPDPAVAAAAAAASAAPAAQHSFLDERKAALGMSDQTADVIERRSAGSGKAAFQDKRAAMRNSKAAGSDANNIPLGGKKQTSSGAGEEGSPQGDKSTDETATEGAGKLPEVADVKRGRDQTTGFGAWSTVSYQTAYTAPVEDEAQQHAYKTPNADGEDSSGEEEDNAPKLEARTEWKPASEDDGAEKVAFKKRKLKRCVSLSSPDLSVHPLCTLCVHPLCAPPSAPLCARG